MAKSAPTGDVVGDADTQTLTNKSFVDANCQFVDDGDNTKVLAFELSGITTGNTSIITIPDSDGVLATQAYVDTQSNQSDWKESIILASTDALNDNASITGSITYNNTGGSGGRGQITATLAVTDTFTLDGVSLGVADDGVRVLLKNEADTATDPDGARNGIWTTTISGTSLTLDRAIDFDEDDEVTSGACMWIEEGSALASSGWRIVTQNPIVIGGASGTVLSITQFSGAAEITAGTGMTKAGNTLDVVGSSTVIANADSLELNSSATANEILLSSGSVGTASTFGALPLGDANSVSGTLGVARGGTGAATFAANGVLFGNGATDIQVMTAAANSVLTTNGSNVPSLTTSLPSGISATDRQLPQHNIQHTKTE